MYGPRWTTPVWTTDGQGLHWQERSSPSVATKQTWAVSANRTPPGPGRYSSGRPPLAFKLFDFKHKPVRCIAHPCQCPPVDHFKVKKTSLTESTAGGALLLPSRASGSQATVARVANFLSLHLYILSSSSARMGAFSPSIHNCLDICRPGKRRDRR